MFDVKKFLKVNKITLIFILIAILFVLVPVVYSKFFSNTIGENNVETAYYILKPDYHMVDTLNLGDLIPRDEPYVHTFSISNTDGTNRLETELNYSLEIITTTNLPLTYEIYLNGNYDVNIISSEDVYQDEYSTYFKKINVPSRFMGFNRDITDTYTLKVYFPSTYKDIKYQNIPELFEVDIKSKQVISGDN